MCLQVYFWSSFIFNFKFFEHSMFDFGENIISINLEPNLLIKSY